MALGLIAAGARTGTVLLPPWRAEVVSLGSREAALRVWRFRFYGLPARFLWLVGYLLIMPGIYVRTRVFLDWLLALVFGRDTTLLRLGPSPGGQGQQGTDFSP